MVVVVAGVLVEVVVVVPTKTADAHHAVKIVCFCKLKLGHVGGSRAFPSGFFGEPGPHFTTQ